MKRILQLTDSIEKRNGRMSVVMNIYRKIDRNRIQFDFLVTDYGCDNYYDEIIKLGGNVYFLPVNKQSLREIKNMFMKVTSSQKYDYIHYHAVSRWGECINYAKKQNVKVIVHSHATRMSDSFIKSIRNRIFSLNVLNCSDKRVAISPEAGKELFLWRNFEYIPNMVSYSKFAYSTYDRKLFRQKYNINNDEKVIGMVGRISKQKNQLFALKVLNMLLKSKLKVKLMIIGDNDIKEKKYYENIKEYIYSNHLDTQIIFTGLVDNPEKYYSMFDVFWLPSLYEGMPTVGIEAQANGLPIIVSNTVTKSMMISNNIKYLTINKKKWFDFTKKALKEYRNLDAIQEIRKSPFNEMSVVNRWMKLYEC